MADPASFGFGTYMDPLVADAVRASDCSLAKPRTPTWPLPGSSPSLAAAIRRKDKLVACMSSAADFLEECAPKVPGIPTVIKALRHTATSETSES